MAGRSHTRLLRGRETPDLAACYSAINDAELSPYLILVESWEQGQRIYVHFDDKYKYIQSISIQIQIQVQIQIQIQKVRVVSFDTLVEKVFAARPWHRVLYHIHTSFSSRPPSSTTLAFLFLRTSKLQQFENNFNSTFRDLKIQ